MNIESRTENQVSPNPIPSKEPFSEILLKAKDSQLNKNTEIYPTTLSRSFQQKHNSPNTLIKSSTMQQNIGSDPNKERKKLFQNEPILLTNIPFEICSLDSIKNFANNIRNKQNMYFLYYSFY